jgi:hypothetical protein
MRSSAAGTRPPCRWTQFALDQPSTVFAGFAGPAIAELGTDLDYQLGELLTALGVKATDVLSPARVAGRLASAAPGLQPYPQVRP